jgi:hypothetical protein
VVAPALVQVIQEVIPLIVCAAGGIGFRANRLVRAPDDFELAGLDDPAEPKDLPRVLVHGIDANRSARRIKGLILYPVADRTRIRAPCGLDCLRPKEDAGVTRFHGV